MELSALGNQHRSKLTVQVEITSKSETVFAFESSSLTVELKLESRLVGWSVGQMCLSLVIKCQVCTFHGDVRDGRAEMGNKVKVKWKKGRAWMARTIIVCRQAHHPFLHIFKFFRARLLLQIQLNPS